MMFPSLLSQRPPNLARHESAAKHLDGNGEEESSLPLFLFEKSLVDLIGSLGELPARCGNRVRGCGRRGRGRDRRPGRAGLVNDADARDIVMLRLAVRWVPRVSGRTEL